VEVPGGWVSVPFAAALASAAAMVWLRRRRRHRPGPLTADALEDPDLRPMPPVVARLRRAAREHAPDPPGPPALPQPAVAGHAEPADRGAPRPAPPAGPSGTDLAGLTDLVPAGGLGLTGPGAEAAARALLVAALSAGSPDDPDARSQVVIPADTLAALLGADADGIGAIPRLSVASDLADALTRVEQVVIERRRALAEHDADDLDQLRAADPFYPPMPPVLLLAAAPAPQARARLSAALHLGSSLQVSAVLLGEWARGETLTVQADGRAEAADGRRLPVLDIPASVELLRLLREAHTGQPAPVPPAEPAPPNPSPGPAPDPARAADQPEASPPAARPRGEKVRVRVLGRPAVLDSDGKPVPGLRHHAAELLVYLAVCREGADLPVIMEAFWPNATLRRASERLSTEAGNLRRCIRQAAGDPSIKPVVNTGGRYHLDPDLLEVDAWALADALGLAARAADPADRVALLRRAVDAGAGILAEGCDYDWIEQPREQHRRHGARARLHLADLLASADPGQAAALAGAAADLDPYNEELARRAMRALADAGDPAGARARMRKLRAALDEIDEEPSPDTIALAARLPRGPAAGARPAGGRP
jgi:DNA-binding SARP family transcriptional activator